VDPVFAATLRGGLALLFATAAVHKLRDLPGFRATLAEYRVLPARIAPVAAAVVIGLEVAAAAALVAPIGAAPGALLAIAMLAAYTLAIAVNVARGRTDLDCGCLGPALRQPIGGAVLARNAILLAAALACLAPVGERSLGWVDAMTIVAAVATVAALYAASQQLLSTATGLAELRRVA
jgi:hypothetical protein